MNKLITLLFFLIASYTALAYSSQDILNLVPTSQVTVKAVTSGNWNSASTWNNGVPGNGAKVHIPQGITVTLTHEDAARLDWIRVDGTLKFQPSSNTRLTLETLVVTGSGTLEIGTSSNPIDKSKTAKIIIRTDRDISDSKKLGRGILNLGKVETHGAVKSPFVKVKSGLNPGSTKLVLKESVSDWSVGDKLILTGVRWNEEGSYADNSRNQDELLEITSISGNDISFKNLADQSNQLKYDHRPPNGFNLDVYVANSTRNVLIETEDYENASLSRRGHTMSISNETKWQWTGFIGMGRSDLSTFTGYGGLSEYNGRYPVHAAQFGPSTKVSPMEVTGCTIYDSPGWGCVNDDSYVVVRDNVSFDVYGAHFVGVKGSETGSYEHNIAIKSDGKTISGTLTEQGIEGEGFFFYSAGGIALKDNVVASVRFAGILVFGNVHSLSTRPLWKSTVEYLAPELQQLFPGQDEVDSWKVPFREFSNNEFYNADVGIHIRGHLRDRSGLDQFSKKQSAYTRVYKCKTWSTRKTGIWIDHATKIKVEECVVVSYPAKPEGEMFYGVNWPNRTGIYAQKNIHYIEFINDTIAGWGAAIGVPQTLDHGIPEDYEAPVGQSILDGGYFVQNERQFRPCSAFEDHSYDNQVYPKPPYTMWFEMKNAPIMESTEQNTPPSVDFSFEAKAGLGIAFDGSNSQDSEYQLSSSGVLDQNDNNLPIFSWDFGDGTKGYGVKPVHNYNCDGTYQVTLTVYDSHGAKASKTKTVSVQGAAYPNLVMDAGFDGSYEETYGTVYSVAAFHATSFWTLNKNGRWNIGGGRSTTKDAPGGGGLVQIVFDHDRVYKGQQEIKFDAVNSSGNTLNIKVWGVKGHWFNVSAYREEDPVNGDYYTPAQIVKLFDHDVAQTSSWKTVTNNIDLKNGYDYYIIKRWTDGSGTKGFDNLFIGNSEYNNAGCNCVLELSKFSHDFGTDAGNTTVTVTSAESYTVSDDQEWITVSKNSNTVTISVTENTGKNDRSGTVTISGCTDKTITINQKGTGGSNDPGPGPDPKPGTCGNGVSFVQSSGELVIEAENYNGSEQRNDIAQWSTGNSQGGFSGSGYVYIAEGAVNNDIGTAAENAQLIYNVEFTDAGTYTIWVRRWAPDGAGNSVFAALSGTQSTEYDNTGDSGNWVWKSLGTVTVSGAGVYTFELIRREDGYLVDKLVVNSGEQPSGEGPDETNCISTNITDYKPENEMRIYPNPATTSVIVDLGEQIIDVNAVTLVNYLGQTVQFMKNDAIEKQLVVFDVSALPQGLYHVLINVSGNEKIIRKIVISR